jgi:hypothetical protein
MSDNGRDTWLIWSPPKGNTEFAVSFQRGSRVGARAFRTIYVEAENIDAAIDAAEKEILKSQGGSKYTYKGIQPF